MLTKWLICCNVCMLVQTIPHCTMSPMAMPIAMNTTANGAKRRKYHQSLIDDLKNNIICGIFVYIIKLCHRYIIIKYDRQLCTDGPINLQYLLL